MKKALALVLALVLALSMAVSAFAADVFVNLKDQTPAEAEPAVIPVVDAFKEDVIVYTTPGWDMENHVAVFETVYYVALPLDIDYKEIKVTASGNATSSSSSPGRIPACSISSTSYLVKSASRLLPSSSSEKPSNADFKD